MKTLYSISWLTIKFSIELYYSFFNKMKSVTKTQIAYKHTFNIYRKSAFMTNRKNSYYESKLFINNFRNLCI